MNARWRRYLRFRGPNVPADVDDELSFHLDMRARDYAHRGLDPNAARQAAHERFGDVNLIGAQLRAHDERLARAQNRRDLMDDLRQDLRYALRSLRRAPTFSVVAILTLALGIGANTAVFSVVDAVLLRELPYPRPDELTAISGSTLAEFTRIRELSTSFSDVATYQPVSLGVSGDAEPERVDAASVSANLLSMLAVRPELGRTFTADENTPGHTNVAVLSFGLWTRRFAANRAVVGRSIVIEGAPYTIVGVMPAEFGFPDRGVELWTPFETPAAAGAFWGSGGYRLVARLGAGMSRDRAQQEVRTLYTRIGLENPVWHPGPLYQKDATVAPLQQVFAGSARTMLWLLLGVVGIVLLIACANVANLMLVRATSRQKEIAIRMALGGGRGRLLRQLLTESAVLAALGGVAGVAFAWWGIRGIGSLLPEDLARNAALGIDARVLAFTALLVVATGIVFGLIPSLRTSRAGAATLRDGSRASRSGSNRRLAGALVSAEIGAAALLVMAALLLIQSVAAIHRADPGFRTTSLVTARLSPPAAEYDRPGALASFSDEVLRRVRALPRVEDAAAVDQIPLDGKNFGIALRIQGQFEDLRGSPLPMSDHSQIVSPGFFTTIGIPVTAGRAFSATDRAEGEQVAIVNESFARHHWAGQSAVGKRIGYPWPSDWITVVGVVRDAKTDSLTGTPGETVYRPLAQAQPRALSFIIRTSVDAAAIGAALREITAQVDPRAPVSRIATMRAIVDRSAARQRFAMLLLALFATIAVALGVVGIYGVMSYAVAQRTPEIGIRIALGAAPGDALRLVLREGMGLAACGLVAGIAAAAISTRALSGLLYGVSARDPLTFIAVPVGIAAVALLATYVPARRATAVDPTRALRAD